MAKRSSMSKAGQATPAVDRRDFLKASSGAAGVLATAGATVATSASVAAAQAIPATPSATPAAHPAPHVATGLRQLILAIPGKHDDAIAGSEAHRLARRLEDAVGDGLRITVRPTSSGIADALHTTECDLVLNTTFALSALDPAFKMFAGLPLGLELNPLEHTSWLIAGGGQSLWDAAGDAHNLKFLVAGWTGPGAGLAATQQSILLHKARLSAHGLAADAARASGADVVSHTDSELHQAFEAGTLDVAQPIHQPLAPVAPFTARDSLQPQGAFIALTMRSTFWAKLPRAEQAIITGIAAEAIQISAAENITRAHMAEAARTYRNMPSVADLHILDAKLFTHNAHAAVDAVAQSSPNARRIVESYRSWRDLMHDNPPSGAALS